MVINVTNWHPFGSTLSFKHTEHVTRAKACQRDGTVYAVAFDSVSGKVASAVYLDGQCVRR